MNLFKLLGKIIAPIVKHALDSEANQKKIRDAAGQAADRAVRALASKIK